jgi:site-specific recombinase XerD
MPRRLPDWDAAVGAFLAECRRRNLSPATLEAYRYNLLGGRARSFVEERGIRTVADLDADCLRALELSVLDAGRSASTAHIFHRVWRTFARFCEQNSWLGDPSILHLSGPELPQREPETFTEDEERRLLAAAERPRRAVSALGRASAARDAARDRFLVEFLLATGVRLREVCAVTVDDILDTPQGPLLRVRQGKGRKDRGIPLDTGKRKFSRRVAAYIRDVRPRDTECRALFLQSRRDGRDYAPLAPHGVYQVLHRLGQETGIHCHPHKFRHTFATRALAAGVDSLVLQRALGHTTLSMVNRYTHFAHGDMLEAWRRRED